jgi:hypothetical protein
MIICPECSTKNIKDSKFCQNCGFGLNSKVQTKKRISEEIDDVIFTPKKKSKFWLFLIIIALILIASGGFVYLFGQQQETSSPENSVSANSKVDIELPTWEKDINKQYSFPLRDAYGSIISNIYYSVDSVELRKEIIVQGKKATAIEGRQFLIVNISLSNKYNKPVEMNTRDYIRLSANNSNDWIAPDVHNDPVEIQALSSKFTKLGFPINESDTNLVLQVGQLNGTKNTIRLDSDETSYSESSITVANNAKFDTNVETQTPEPDINPSEQLSGTYCTNPVEIISLNSIESLGSGRVKLSWTPLNKATTSYSIFYSTSPMGFTLLTSAGSSGSQEIGGLPQNTKYYFLVQTQYIEAPKGCSTSYSKSVIIN